MNMKPEYECVLMFGCLAEFHLPKFSFVYGHTHYWALECTVYVYYMSG